MAGFGWSRGKRAESYPSEMQTSRPAEGRRQSRAWKPALQGPESGQKELSDPLHEVCEAWGEINLPKETASLFLYELVLVN